MAGLPVITDPNTGATNVLDTNYVTRAMGATAQNWAGPVMASGGTSVSNSNASVAPGNPKPVDSTAGYLAAGMPQGNPSLDIVPNSDGDPITSPAAPTLGTATSGGTVLAGTYKVEVSYVYPWGESGASASTSQVTTGSTSTLTVNSPAASLDAIGWFAYVTQVGGNTYTRQQAAGTPTAIGTNLTLTAPPTSTGASPLPAAASENILSVGAPAGNLSGGGGIYPNTTGASAVPNPFVASGWTAQNTAAVFLRFAYTPVTFAHGTSQTINPTTLALSSGSDTFTVTVKEVNGVLTSTLPTGFSLAASTGVISLSGSTVAGVTTIGLVVTDNAGRNAEADIVVTLT